MENRDYMKKNDRVDLLFYDLTKYNSGLGTLEIIYMLISKKYFRSEMWNNKFFINWFPMKVCTRLLQSVDIILWKPRLDLILAKKIDEKGFPKNIAVS